MRPELVPSRPSLLHVLLRQQRVLDALRLLLQILDALRQELARGHAGEVQLGVLRARLRSLFVSSETGAERGSGTWRGGRCVRRRRAEQAHGASRKSRGNRLVSTLRADSSGPPPFARVRAVSRDARRAPGAAFSPRTSLDALVRSAEALRSICAALDLMAGDRETSGSCLRRGTRLRWTHARVRGFRLRSRRRDA